MAKSGYKVTINPELDIDQYPLPKPEELFARLAGGKGFTKIDLTHAYQQMILEESSRKFVTINTHRGLYELTRLPFGVASAPVMDTVLQGIDQDNLLHRRYPRDREHCGGAPAKSGKRPQETPEIWHTSQES